MEGLNLDLSADKLSFQQAKHIILVQESPTKYRLHLGLHKNLTFLTLSICRVMNTTSPRGVSLYLEKNISSVLAFLRSDKGRRSKVEGKCEILRTITKPRASSDLIFQQESNYVIVFITF